MASAPELADGSVAQIALLIVITLAPGQKHEAPGMAPPKDAGATSCML